MHFEDIVEGKVRLGDVTYNLTEAKINGQVIWPAGVAMTYVVTSAQMFYSTNNNYVDAAGTTYAYIMGDYDIYRNGQYYTSRYNQPLTPVVSNSDFVVQGGLYVYGRNLGQVETSQMKTAEVRAVFGNSEPYFVGTIRQEQNVKTAVGEPTYGQKQYGTPEFSRYDYRVTLTPGAYASSSSRCPASGGTTTLTAAASHMEGMVTPWTQTVTQNYTYTATPGQSFPETTTQSGSEPSSPVQVSDTPTISRISGSSDITLSGTTVTIPSEGQTEYSSGRSATFRATNGTATSDVTFWQQANVHISTSYVYNLACSINVNGDIPASGGIFQVFYTSRGTPTEVWTSGSYPGTEIDLASSIETENCTPSVNSVTGTGSFTIEVTENTSAELMRNISVVVKRDNNNYASDIVSQEASSVVTTPTARIYPDVDTDGRVRLRFQMTQGSFPSSPVVISGLVYHYVLSGSVTEQTRNISDVTVSSDGEAVRLSIQNTWFSGDSGTHWFAASGVSGIGVSNVTFTHTEFDVRSLE